MEKQIEFKSRGTVLGNYWGGGQGSYSARTFFASSKEELIELNKKALADGSLDSGMGYESLIGARLVITTTTTINIEEKPYTNSEIEIEFIGELDDDQINFLEGLYDE
jgi:hypothetical protein